MQRVKRSTAVLALPAAPVGGVPGYFAQPAPGGGVPATVPGFEWFNGVQEALMTVIETAGLAGSDNDHTNLMQALNLLFSRLSVAQVWTKAQRGAVLPLVDGAIITPDFALANNFSVTLAGNRTLAAPTNLVSGQSGIITIAQDATGSRTLAFASAWKFAGGTIPSLTEAANAVDALAYYVNPAGTTVFAALSKDVK